MSRFIPVLALGLLATPAGFAQSAAEPAPAPGPTAPAAMAAPVKAAPAEPAAASEPRVVSDSTAALLNAGRPRFTPPKPVAAAPAQPADEDADLRLLDRPKNKIVRLPQVVVRDRPSPVFTARTFQNEKDVTELGFKKYSGLRLSPFSSLNAPIAKAMYQEDQRLDDFADLKGSAAAISRGGDADEADYLHREVNGAFMHDIWGSGEPDSPFANPRH